MSDLTNHTRPSDQTLPPKDYLDRNHDIVDQTDLLIATPKENTEVLRSGTWATIRYAKKINKPTWIIETNGNIWKGILHSNLPTIP